MYDWKADAVASYHVALRFMALSCGSRRPETLFELYWCEGKGIIP